jgi:hypothetical protein
MASDFMDALLSMDAYNRGANAGLKVDVTKLGDFNEYVAFAKLIDLLSAALLRSFPVLVSAFCIINSAIAQQIDEQTTMHAVALLFHGRYGEQPYTLTAIADGALALKGIAGGPVRFVVRAVPGRRCVFVATHDDKDGLNVEQIDFAKFDGTHQVREACGQKGTILESECNASLYFKSEQGFCQYSFASDRQIDLANVPFPEVACRPLAYGTRKREYYAKYVVAFDYVFKQCAPSVER